MADKILFVDDDSNILSGFQRSLRTRFKVETTDSAAKAFEILKGDSSFAVIVSDYRMPNMNGVDFLSQAAVKWPNCVRVLLTGEADTRAAGAAVNQGQIFRFLLKPCPPLILEKTLTAALKHHQMLNSEESLLEETLRGSMEALVELLRFTNPRAFQHSHQLYKVVRELVRDLPVEDKWEFELSGLLAEVGNVTIPPELLVKISTESPLTPAETKLYASRTAFAERLLEKVPRLELVAKILGAQSLPMPSLPAWQSLEQVDRFALGVNLLKLAVCWNECRLKGLSAPAFLLEARSQGFPPLC
jgi:response regulator RpfG family c-di-GMP phosphodiesterase